MTGPLPVRLPGFYWDEERNRYFPISSRPPTTAVVTPPSTTTLIHNHPHLWSLSESFRATPNFARRHALRQRVSLHLLQCQASLAPHSHIFAQHYASTTLSNRS